MSEETAKADLASLRIQRDVPRAAAASDGKSRTWVWIVLAGVVVATGGLWAWTSHGRVIEVQTARVERLAPATVQSLLTATGYVVAQRKAAVASKGTGRLEVLNVQEGDAVKAGDVIARLEAHDVNASLESARSSVTQAEATLAQARAVEREAKLNFDRVQELRTKDLASQSDFDVAEARYGSAEAGADAARAALETSRAAVKWAEVQVENTIIRAPFDGTVLTKQADVGEVVAPFASSSSSRAAVVTIADMSSLEVEADVSESNIQRIAVGQPCLITLDAFPAEPYRGTVKKIVPTADRAKATVLTKVGFDRLDGRVLPEMSAKVNFLPAQSDLQAVNTATVLSVPQSALVHRDGHDVVFVVRQGRAYATQVEVGQTYGSALEIKSGVQMGDVVVTPVPDALSDRGQVKLKS
ncbi:MAG: efflux RND transporter periplasmic adaptor subunit [candidate division Zixibacteria bacterium]|nr:efflux RND transporter periplasmic adaptor subunit [candidate division Zixibacteria bacterium]